MPNLLGRKKRWGERKAGSLLRAMRKNYNAGRTKAILWDDYTREGAPALVAKEKRESGPTDSFCCRKNCNNAEGRSLRPLKDAGTPSSTGRRKKGEGRFVGPGSRGNMKSQRKADVGIHVSILKGKGNGVLALVARGRWEKREGKKGFWLAWRMEVERDEYRKRDKRNSEGVGEGKIPEGAAAVEKRRRISLIRRGEEGGIFAAQKM